MAFTPGCCGLFELLDKLSVSRFGEFFNLDEAEGGGIDAVAQSRRRRSVVKDMAEMRIALAAADLGPGGEKAPVLMLDDVVRNHRPVKLGQPVPESNLSRELKSGSPETIST